MVDAAEFVESVVVAVGVLMPLVCLPFSAESSAGLVDSTDSTAEAEGATVEGSAMMQPCTTQDNNTNGDGRPDSVNQPGRGTDR